MVVLGALDAVVVVGVLDELVAVLVAGVLEALAAVCLASAGSWPVTTPG